MSMIDLEALLGEAGTVTYSTLEDTEDRDEFDDSVAQLQLNNGFWIDVFWDNEDRDYVITISDGTYEEYTLRAVTKTPDGVVRVLKNFVRRYAGPQTAFISSVVVTHESTLELQAV